MLKSNVKSLDLCLSKAAGIKDKSQWCNYLISSSLWWQIYDFWHQCYSKLYIYRLVKAKEILQSVGFGSEKCLIVHLKAKNVSQTQQLLSLNYQQYFSFSSLDFFLLFFSFFSLKSTNWTIYLSVTHQKQQKSGEMALFSQQLRNMPLQKINVKLRLNFEIILYS